MEEREDSLAEALGICPEITFEANGKTWIISPPKLGHLGEFEKYAKQVQREEDMKLIKEAAALIPPESVVEMIDDVRKRGMGWSSMILSPFGLQYMMYLRMKQNHPELTLEDVGELVEMELLLEQRLELSELVGMNIFMPSLNKKLIEAGKDQLDPKAMAEAE